MSDNEKLNGENHAGLKTYKPDGLPRVCVAKLAMRFWATRFSLLTLPPTWYQSGC